MSTWLKVARYHLVQPGFLVGLPWGSLAFAFAVNLIVVVLGPGGHPAAATYTGALAVPYVYFFVTGIVTIGQSLPFGLALGVSRRSYYAGTALLGAGLAAADAAGLTALSAIERASGGWGVNLHFFRVPYILDGPWYLTWLTSFVGLTVLFAFGMWFSIVYRRWGQAGSVVFVVGQVSVLLAAALIVSFTDAWAGVAHFFASLTAVGLTGLLAALTVALLAGGHATIRRATV